MLTTLCSQSPEKDWFKKFSSKIHNPLFNDQKFKNPQMLMQNWLFLGKSDLWNQLMPKINVSLLQTVTTPKSSLLCCQWLKTSRIHSCPVKDLTQQKWTSTLLRPILTILVIHLNNYFDFHVCLSIPPSVRPSVCPCFRLLCIRNLTPLPAFLSRNVK